MNDQVNWLKVTYDESDNSKLKDLYVGWSEVYDEEMVEGGYAYPGYIKSIFPHVGIAKDAKILDELVKEKKKELADYIIDTIHKVSTFINLPILNIVYYIINYNYNNCN